jgi:hypothetical protein
MTTVGGVAFRHLDRLPRVGDSISIEDISITVLEMDEHRIARACVSRGSRGEEVLAAGAQADPVDTEEAAHEVQGNPDNELHDDKMPESDDDENIIGARQSGNDDACPEPAGAGDADSNPDLKVVH